MPLKDKKVISITTDAFQKILDRSGCKPNKIWVDKGIKLYNQSFESWLEKNDIEMYSTNIGGTSVDAERLLEP